MANDGGSFPSWNTWTNEMTKEQREYEQHRLLFSLNERLGNQDECIVDLQTRVRRLEHDPWRRNRRTDKLSYLVKQYGFQALLGLFVAAYFLAQLLRPFGG